MAESTKPGPGGYPEVSGTAGSPHAASISAPQVSTPDAFTPPDTSSMGYGASAGGTSGPGGNGGGKLADMISKGGESTAGTGAAEGAGAAGIEDLALLAL